MAPSLSSRPLGPPCCVVAIGSLLATIPFSASRFSITVAVQIAAAVSASDFGFNSQLLSFAPDKSKGPLLQDDVPSLETVLALLKGMPGTLSHDIVSLFSITMVSMAMLSCCSAPSPVSTSGCLLVSVSVVST